MKNFAKFLSTVAIWFAVFMATGFGCNWAMQAYSRFIAECDLGCRVVKFSHDVDKFNTDNPVITFAVLALLFALIIAGNAWAEEKKAARSTEKPKNKPTAVLGDDGEWVHTDNPVPSGYLLPLYEKRRDEVQRQITTVNNVNWFGSAQKETKLAELNHELHDITAKIDQLSAHGVQHHDQA